MGGGSGKGAVRATTDSRVGFLSTDWLVLCSWNHEWRIGGTDPVCEDWVGLISGKYSSGYGVLR